MPTIMRMTLPITAILWATTLTAADPPRPNVLFIAVDDLRPELGCYGHGQMHSPNIDELAAASMLFDRAYCMVPTCGASRASLMTSIRPARHRFVSYRTWAERDAPNAKPLNTHFEQNGYFTVSLGKVFHHPEDHAEGWSRMPWRPRFGSPYERPENQKLHKKRQKHNNRGPAWESADVSDTAYADGRLAERAVETLGKLKEREKPFFLAVGFFKPHLPFIAPQRYWELYDHEEIQLPTNGDVPQNAPPEAIHNFGELRNYAGIPQKGLVPDEMARQLIHGYHACVSYTDAQIGKVLDELDSLGLTDNTIIVLWGDHGWNLGEHTLWCKHCCFETSMRIPLLVHVPGIEGGRSSSRLIETIDIYPTLCELAGLPKPDHVQGTSFVPLLHDPDHDWKDFAIGRFKDGDTIRSDDYRFTEYSNNKGKAIAAMLYNHETDPGETVNIVKKDKAASAVQRLTKALHERMGRDRPQAK